jgi:hypothetical protein
LVLKALSGEMTVDAVNKELATKVQALLDAE